MPFLLHKELPQPCWIVYLSVRLSQLTMAERRSLCIMICFFAFHGSAKGFEVEGHDGNKTNHIFTQEQCLTILATDLETYKGILFKILNLYFHSYIFYIHHNFQILEHLSSDLRMLWSCLK